MISGRAFLDGAMEIYHEIDDERGHAWTHQNLAWVAFQSGDFADAEEQLIEAKSASRSSATPRRQLGARGCRPG